MATAAKTNLTGYWTFFCNPKYWAIDAFLSASPFVSDSEYRIASWQREYFSKGQLGVVRVGLDSRSLKHLGGRERLRRGIYAIVEVTGSPIPEKWMLDPSRSPNRSRLCVPIRYIRNYLDRPVLLTAIEHDSVIRSDRYLITGYQAASMPLAKDAFNRVLLYGEEHIGKRGVL
jgi:hypothetical protein